MLKYRKYQVVLLIFSLVFLIGCPQPYELIFFNNTDSDWTIQFKNGQVNWKSKTQIILKDYGDMISVGNLEWVDNNNWGEGPLLVLKKEGALLKYKIFDCGLPDEYDRYSSEMGKYFTNYQFETDGSIYIVKPDSSFPSQDIHTQPTCFPIRPTKE